MADNVSDSTVVRRASGALTRRLLGGMLVLAPGMTEPVRVVTPGEVLWDLLRDAPTIADLVDALAEHYGEDASTVRADMVPFLESLRGRGALTLMPPTS